MTTQEKVEERLSKEWPKHCGCGKAYNPLTWLILPYAYTQVDAFATMEARHCKCGSTIVVLVAIHDLDAE